MLSLIAGILYLIAPNDMKTGVIFLTVVIATLFLLFTGPSVEYMDAVKPNIKAATVSSSCKNYGKRDPVSGVIEVDVLPQVDSLGRSVDDKMALNKTASIIAAPGGVNAAFVEGIESSENLGGLQPANDDNLPGSLI